jgi:hypothetical protein
MPGFVVTWLVTASGTYGWGELRRAIASMTVGRIRPSLVTSLFELVAPSAVGWPLSRNQDRP